MNGDDEREGAAGRAWHCSTSLKGRLYRVSTKEDGLEQAKAFAEDWYLGLRGKLAAGVLKTETTFAEARADEAEQLEHRDVTGEILCGAHQEYVGCLNYQHQEAESVF